MFICSCREAFSFCIPLRGFKNFGIVILSGNYMNFGGSRLALKEWRNGSLREVCVFYVVICITAENGISFL